LSFSYGRTLQDPALTAWGGKPSGIGLGQQALYHHARCNSAASMGKYDESMETDAVDVETRVQMAGAGA
jgi:fructose-bisphosphate aldolase class I